MPFVRISLVEGRPEPHRQAIADAVHQAMVDTIDVAADDRFQIVTEHARDTITFRGRRQEGGALFVFVQITLNAGRTAEKKHALYRRLAELLSQRAGIRAEDLFVSLVDVDHDNWFVPVLDHPHSPP